MRVKLHALRPALLRRTALAVCLIVASGLAQAELIRLSADPGHFRYEPLAEMPARTLRFSVAMRIREFTDAEGWPPASYMGIFQGTDRRNSLQVLAIRNQPADATLVVGYRLIVDGQEREVASLLALPPDEAIQVEISFDEGMAAIRIGPSAPLLVSTPFAAVVPYVSVSSATAEFQVVR